MLESNSELEPQPGAEPLTVEQAIANLSDTDTSLRYYAAWWLGKFQIKDSRAINALIRALEDEDDRTEMGGYPLRRNAARALGKLDDRRAVPGLTRCLECDDFYVRESAAQALGLLGDASCVPQLMTLLEGGIEVAQFVPDRPHLVQPVEAVLEALGALEATEAIDLVRPFLNHSVARVQYAAARSMYQLTRDPAYGEQLVQALQGNDVQLRRSALADLGAIGYIPAADAIATAPVENSFKLLSCKGLLDYHLRETGDPLSSDAIKLMTLMDQLL
ncbi:HEAT repeat domain-containing protein [Leptolyngbya sp. DQ-M1]|uniref:HEAT repeat domain-containing protein n=1 Tax=Leptolyngbya sp. DQ-M1 TaxID=2933920 RepID=UPI0032973922